MKKKFVHISDLHYRQGWYESQGVVLEAFFEDLDRQVSDDNDSELYIVFSGDVVQAGGDKAAYAEVAKTFGQELNSIGIPYERRIVVPGNHDVETEVVSGAKVEHEGIIVQGLNEQEFNEYAANAPDLMSSKFSNYKTFADGFGKYGVSSNAMSGDGWSIDDQIGIYCLNSAWLSSGKFGNDEGRLLVDTRRVAKWSLENKCRYRILIMHHPLSWLDEWCQQELAKILNKYFAVCLSGHVHEQELIRTIGEDSPLNECSAPALHSCKTDKLGYSIVTIGDAIGDQQVMYRQWSNKHRKFLRGVDFAGVDSGSAKLVFGRVNRMVGYDDESSRNIESCLSANRTKALKSFSSQPIIWVNPVLSDAPESCASSVSRKQSNDSETEDKDSEPRMIDLDEILYSRDSIVIKAPALFGQSSLAAHLAFTAWQRGEGLWLVLDARDLKPHKVEKMVNAALGRLGASIEGLTRIVLDHWMVGENLALKVLKKICDLYPRIPILVMQRLGGLQAPDSEGDEIDFRPFKVFHMWSMPRRSIRTVVSEYNDSKHIGDDDVVITRVVSDLTALNLHRTPLNCLTLLKVAEADFDESPVNRTEMIHRVLFLIFNVDDIPNYKSRPDLKDCEFVLGYFCEKMIRSGHFTFTRADMLNHMRACCAESLIDLEVHIVFDVLEANNILVNRGDMFAFRFAY